MRKLQSNKTNNKNNENILKNIKKYDTQIFDLIKTHQFTVNRLEIPHKVLFLERKRNSYIYDLIEKQKISKKLKNKLKKMKIFDEKLQKIWKKVSPSICCVGCFEKQCFCIKNNQKTLNCLICDCKGGCL